MKFSYLNPSISQTIHSNKDISLLWWKSGGLDLGLVRCRSWPRFQGSLSSGAHPWGVETPPFWK